MPDIFLSYSRQDAAVASKMAAALSAAGHDVWWDQALRSGEVYDQVIETALRSARVVVVLWSKTAVVSDWVRSEATVAMQRGALMPVIIEPCQRPVSFELRQSADLTGWKGNAQDPRLVAFVAEVSERLGAAPAAPVPAVAPKPGPDRRMLIGGAAGVAALAAGGFGAWKSMGGGKADDGTASVVVLPFANLSGDPAQAFFSDGIAEELRNALSQIRGLKVIGRVSSEAFRDTADVSAAADKLGVDHVLTGSVRRSPTTIRIGAQLIDGKTGVETWSQSYDQPAGDSLAIQSKIASSVVATLSAKLAMAAGTIMVGGTSNPAAQELFFKAGDLFRIASSEASIRQQLAFVDAAIALDAGYADAWARRSSLLANLRTYEPSASGRAILNNDAMAAARRAVKLAPRSGFAHISLAGRNGDRFDFRRALAEGEMALALAPQDGRVRRNHGLNVWCFDPDRGVALTREALATDPLNPFFLTAYANALNNARQYRDSIAIGLQAMALNQNTGPVSLVISHLALSQIGEARSLLKNIQNDLVRAAYTAIVEARDGQRAASDAALAEFRRNPLASFYLLSIAHAQRGEIVAALDALEAAFANRERRIGELTFDLMFDPIRNEPRFKAVQDAIIPPDLFVPPRRR